MSRVLFDLRNASVVFLAIFLAELPDKTMFATLILATRLRRPLAVWLGVSLAYSSHVFIAVAFGSVIAKLPERPIQLLVGLVFLISGVAMLRGSRVKEDAPESSGSVTNFFRASYIAMATILVAEFADLTQLATVGFAVRLKDPLGVAIGAASALCAVSALAILAGTWLQTKIRFAAVQRIAAAFFIVFGLLALANGVV